jgi:hypothetical protein
MGYRIFLHIFGGHSELLWVISSRQQLVVPCHEQIYMLIEIQVHPFLGEHRVFAVDRIRNEDYKKAIPLNQNLRLS